jgi:lipid-binding SYLF domain-containing protein
LIFGRRFPHLREIGSFDRRPVKISGWRSGNLRQRSGGMQRRKSTMKAKPIPYRRAFLFAAAACLPFAAAAADSTPGAQTPRQDASASAEQKHDAATHLKEAEQVVRQMTADPDLKGLMARAKGIFVVPTYGRAALVVGAQGGPGVLVVRQDEKWSGPAFYNFGGMSIGAQAGAVGGKIAMLLMSERAVNAFTADNKFSFNADAGFTLVNYSARMQVAGKEDVILWSDTTGLFANASVGVTDINWDEKETRAFYGRSVTQKDIVAGKVASPKAQALLQALPGPAKSTAKR